MNDDNQTCSIVWRCEIQDSFTSIRWIQTRDRRLFCKGKSFCTVRKGNVRAADQPENQRVACNDSTLAIHSSLFVFAEMLDPVWNARPVLDRIGMSVRVVKDPTLSSRVWEARYPNRRFSPEVCHVGWEKAVSEVGSRHSRSNWPTQMSVRYWTGQFNIPTGVRNGLESCGQTVWLSALNAPLKHWSVLKLAMAVWECDWSQIANSVNFWRCHVIQREWLITQLVE